MKKIILSFIAGILFCGLSIGQVFAEPSARAYERASEKSIFNRVGDWFATVGKPEKEKQKIIQEREAERRAERLGEAVDDVFDSIEDAAEEVEDVLDGDNRNAVERGWDKVKDKTQKGYEKTKDWTAETYDDTKGATIKGYNKVKKSSKKTYNKMKNAVDEKL